MYDFHPEPRVTSQLVGLSVADVERDLILATLTRTGGNRTHAAGVLGISVRTMRNKLAEYALGGTVIPEPGASLPPPKTAAEQRGQARGQAFEFPPAPQRAANRILLDVGPEGVSQSAAQVDHGPTFATYPLACDFVTRGGAGWF